MDNVFEYPGRFRNTLPGNIDYWYGPHDTPEAATAFVPIALRHLKLVGIKSGTSVEEFWWPNSTDLTITGLKRRQAESIKLLSDPIYIPAGTPMPYRINIADHIDFTKNASFVTKVQNATNPADFDLVNNFKIVERNDGATFLGWDVSDGSGGATFAKLSYVVLSQAAYSSGGSPNAGFSYIEADNNNFVNVSGGVEKILLSSDVVLRPRANAAPGDMGILVLTQDNVGFHSVVLNTGNQGQIEVEQTPNKTTVLEWLVTDTVVFWSIITKNPPDDLTSPTKITDLNWTNLNAQTVQLTFTAPQGNLTSPADRYVIYYSNAPIDADTQLKNLPTYSQKILPGAPGQHEVFTLTKLTAKQTYYFAVVAQKTTYGTLRTGPISNVVTFTTLPLEGAGSDGSTDIMIPIKPENISFINMLFVIDTDGVTLGPDKLVDYSGISMVEGVPVGVTPRNMTLMHTNQYKQGYYNQEMAFYFDLEFEFTVNHLFIYPIAGSDEKPIYTSTDGANWILAGVIDAGAPKNAWFDVELDPTRNTNVRYIKITTDYTQTVWGGIVFSGKRESAQNVIGQKYKNSVISLPLPKKIGTNTNIANDPVFAATVASIVRLYSNHVWYTDEVDKYKPGAALAGLVTLANIEYKFVTAQAGNSDAFFQACKDAGTDIMFCMVGMPYFLAPDPNTDDNTAKRRKPLDSGLEMSLVNTTNPMNYKFIAQFYWQVAARYGNTAGQPNGLFRIKPGETIKKGLGLIKYFELGLNEPTGASESDQSYTNPEELAAIISACYDGHNGAMGAGFGIKDADPTAIPVMVGLTAVPLGYKMAMLRWWDVNRGIGNYPIDIMTEHYYNAVGGPPVQENLYATPGLYGLPPEQGYFEHFITEHVNFRNRSRTIQNVQFWLTETGYDEHLGSFYAPQDASVANRGWKKALWTVRIFLMMDIWGLDTVLQYAIFSFANLSEMPNSGEGNIWATFATSGYLDGNNGVPNRPKLQAYYYATAFQKAMAGYSFSHAVRVKGVSNTTDTVTLNTDPDLYIAAYKTTTPGAKSMLVFWLGNELLTKTVNLNVMVGVSELNISTINFDDLHTSHAEVGTAGSIASTPQDTARKIALSVTATPQIIFTNAIGTPKLIEPQNITVQSITATQVKIAWVDKNLGLNNTRIYRSTNPDTGFAQIYDAYIDNGEYVDASLSEFTTYYYKIQFESGTRVSALSASYGIQTLRSINVPSAFTHTGQSPSTITLGWVYGSSDAAYIDGFELWRSTSIAGIYSKVATIDHNALSYTDVGLVADTTYYYKLRAFKGLSFGNYTATLNTTTDPISLTPPALVSTESNYAGDRITLKFTLPISNPAGLESYFTVVEAPGTENRVIPVISVTLNAADATKVYLTLDSILLSPANSIKFSYDGVAGTLQSIYGVKAASITNQTSTNRYNDPTLLVKRMKFNLMADGKPSGLSDWNDYSLTGRAYNSTQLVIAANTDSGASTPYKFTMNEKNPDTHIQNIIDVTSNPASYFSTGDPVNAQFPIAVRTITAVIGSGTQTTLIFALMKLDTTKIYNIKLYGWLYPGVEGTQSVQANGAGISKVITPAGNVSELAILNNVKPANIALPAVSADAINDGYSSPKVTITVTNLGDDRAAATAMIIDEVIDN